MALNIPVGYGLAVMTHAVPFAGQTQLCTFGFNVADIDDDPNDIAEGLSALWAGGSGPCAPSTVADSTRFNGTKVYIQKEVGLVLGEHTANIDCTRSTQPPAPQVALICKKRTALVGRRYRGRMYLPASYLVGTQVGPSGVIDTTALAAIQTRMTNWLADMASSLQPVVLFHTTAPFTATPVTSLVLETVIGTQRRRVR